MIEERELRLGNWINEPENNKAVEVLAISHVITIRHSKKFIQLNFECFNPIPLTPEWLVKLGFKRYYNDSTFRIQIGHDVVDKKAYLTAVLFLGGVVTLYIHSMFQWQIKHVHQLQNVYHALTGKELKIN